MLTKKRTKLSRARGSHTHFGGHKKKRRGAGNRGGVGKSGSGARGDQKKESFLKKYGNSYFGKSGFKSRKKKLETTISLKFIEDNFQSMMKKGQIEKKGTDLIFDAAKLKINKVLGNTKFFSKKLKVIVREISKSAKKKIEELGGSVEIFSKKEKPKKETSKKEKE